MNTYMAAFQGRLVLFMECTATNTKLRTQQNQFLQHLTCTSVMIRS